MGLLITTDIWNWSELCKSLLNSEFICSKAEFWEIVHALFLLLLVQLDLGDLRLQIGEFCIEAACVPISSQIRNKRGFHFTLQKIMLNLQVTNASITLTNWGQSFWPAQEAPNWFLQNRNAASHQELHLQLQASVLDPWEKNVRCANLFHSV